MPKPRRLLSVRQVADQRNTTVTHTAVSNTTGGRIRKRTRLGFYKTVLATPSNLASKSPVEAETTPLIDLNLITPDDGDGQWITEASVTAQDIGEVVPPDASQRTKKSKGIAVIQYYCFTFCISLRYPRIDFVHGYRTQTNIFTNSYAMKGCRGKVQPPAPDLCQALLVLLRTLQTRLHAAHNNRQNTCATAASEIGWSVPSASKRVTPTCRYTSFVCVTLTLLINPIS